MEVEQKNNAPYECKTSSVEIHVDIFKRLLQNDKAGEEYLQMRPMTEGSKLVRISNQQGTEIKLLERPLISVKFLLQWPAGRDLSGGGVRSDPALDFPGGPLVSVPPLVRETPASRPRLGSRSDLPLLNPPPPPASLPPRSTRGDAY